MGAQLSCDLKEELTNIWHERTGNNLGERNGHYFSSNVRVGDGLIEWIRVVNVENPEPKVRVVMDMTRQKDYLAEGRLFYKDKKYAITIVKQ